MKYFIIIASVLLLTAAVAYGGFNYLSGKAREIPSNSPLQCQATNAKNNHVMVALGDSITHAKVSADYVQMLESRDASNQFSYINAGINSRLAFNALQVLDSVIACKPSAVTILIGTNDVLATKSEAFAKHYIDLWQLPQTPDFAFYQDNLTKVIEKLQQQTTAKIAILSLPPIGEKINSPMNNTVAKYNQFIKQSATQYNITYLPLNEQMWQVLNQKGEPDKSCDLADQLTVKAVAKYYLFNDSWNEISAGNNLQLLTDCIHLNESGAEIISGLVQGFLVGVE